MTPTPSRELFRFFLPLTPRWGDMDALGHVNNAKFFTYDESVRLEYFGALMKDDARFWSDYGLILARIEADFLQQLKPPAILSIGFRIARIGRSSLQTEAVMLNGEAAVAVTRGTVVWFDYRRNAPLPVPDDVRARIRSFEAVPPVE